MGALVSRTLQPWENAKSDQRRTDKNRAYAPSLISISSFTTLPRRLPSRHVCLGAEQPRELWLGDQQSLQRDR
jgi:hypothetical protein